CFLPTLSEVQEPEQEWPPSPPLPADHVLQSGAALFPGSYRSSDTPQSLQGAEGTGSTIGWTSQTLRAEQSRSGVDFINYFLCLHKYVELGLGVPCIDGWMLPLHSKKQAKDSLVSVVADLRHASLPTTRFIAETLLLLELHKRTVHNVYIIQPRKKDVVKLLLKLLAPSKCNTASFKVNETTPTGPLFSHLTAVGNLDLIFLQKVLLKEISELSNYIDRSQLTASLGGYLIYCHKSWVAFIKEIDTFVQEFLSVVQRLPSCISTLQALSRLPLPSTFSELQHFCSTNEAKFQQLRRELGLDELLRHCGNVLDKLRYPEKEPCYQAMAGTALFTHTAFDMLQNHSRITAAVEKVELLWQQAFSKARLQLQVLQLQHDALLVKEQIKTLLEEKLQPHKIQIAKDAANAVMLVSEFEASVHTPAMALVGCAEDVIHMSAAILPFDTQTREHWVLDLERLKDKLHSAVNFILQTFRAVSNYHHYYSKAKSLFLPVQANSWYSLVLYENFLQELLSGLNGNGLPTHKQKRNRGTIPAWRYKMSTFLKKHPPPDMEELVHLANLSNVIPDEEIQQAGQQMSQRCMTLRKLLISSGPVAVGHLQLALQWQYELLLSSHVNNFSADSATNVAKDVQALTHCESVKEAAHLLKTSPSAVVSGFVSAEGKPPSLSSFDSGFDGAGSGQLEVWGGREAVEGLSRLAGSRDSVRPALNQPQVHSENISGVSDSENHREEFEFGSIGNSSRASIQIIPKGTSESLNFEIKVKRSAALPSNPWLSLPVDDLENSYTVTITQNPTPQKTDLRLHDANQSRRSRDQPTQTEQLSSTQHRGSRSRDWMLHSQSSLEDPELSPISNILSSTITDGRDKSMCTTEGIPTLLWDSYDLHDQNQDTVDGLDDMSLKDWDVKEQEGLREVEKILDRADEILQKEENVLAQEAVLDALLRSEDRQNQWPLWDCEDQLGVMSSSELDEAGVLGLEDYLVPAEADNLSEPEGETKAAENTPLAALVQCPSDTVAFPSNPGLLPELRKVHILDELIMEENLKIHKLRCYKENPDEELCGSKCSDANRLSRTSKERETFRLQLEKEKMEVEKLEKSLDKQCKAEKHKHKERAKKVVKCSIMEKARTENKEDQALCYELLSGSCNRLQRTRSVSLVQNDSQVQDMCKTENIQAVLEPDVAKEDTPQDLVQLPDSQCQEHCPETEPSAFNGATLKSTDLRKTPEEQGIQPQGCIYGDKLDGSGENVTIYKPEASLTLEMRPDDGAFDPGGKSQVLPVAKPRKASLLVKNDLEEPEIPHSTELQNLTLSSVAHDPCFVQLDLQEKPLDTLPENVTPAISHNLVLNPNVKEHSNNNNNNHAVSEECKVSLNHSSGTTTEVVPESLLQTDLHPAEEVQTFSPADECPHYELAPQLPLDQPLEYDCSGTDELNEDTSDGVQSSKTVRISGSGSAGIQTQPNINMREEIMNGNLERQTYIGHEAQHMRGVLALKHPIKNGIIHNWDEMEKIWHHTFQQLCAGPEDHPVLLTEAAMNPLENRQRMVEIMFECFSVPFTYVAMQAVLALYAAGRCTGVMFDSGDGVSHSVPVFEGYCLPHAVQRFPLAGRDVTMNLTKLLQEQGVCMRTTAEMEITREMKEKCCFVPLNYEAEMSQGGSSCKEMHYTMPDGKIVTLCTERFRAPEILFKPELIGQDHYGMHESVFKSILSSDTDLRRSFLGNIILSGGNTLLPGLPERLQAEIKGLVPTDMGDSVRVTSPKDRDFSVWSGGAVLANLPTFSSAWISQEEYEEYGPQIVFRKCF
ncbi:hypothetical protein L3Q82_010801, partial [Scortum barcoo]